MGEFGRMAAVLLAVAFVSLALSGEAKADESHHHEHHAHHVASEAAAEQSSDHGAHAQETHAHDGECHCVSALCAPLLMPAPLAQLAERVAVTGHDLPPMISADAQAVSGPPARPPRA